MRASGQVGPIEFNIEIRADHQIPVLEYQSETFG